MKSFIAAALASSLTLFCGLSLLAAAGPDKNILVSGKWFNDEYSFEFFTDKSFRSFYTVGKDTGTLTGSWKIKGDSIVLKRKELLGSYNGSILSGDELRLEYGENAADPKSTRYLSLKNSGFRIWHEGSFVKAGTPVTLEPGGVACVAQGYELSATTDNVRVRKGPGTDHDYHQFTYKDVKSGEVKTFGSVLNGTTIRILARTAAKMKVNEWFNNWYYVEYKEPAGDLLAYRTAWMFGEFINVAENRNRLITVTSPENKAAIYGAREFVISGEVTGAPVKMSIQVKNSYGNVVSDTPVESFNQEEGEFSHSVSLETETLFFGSNTYNFTAYYSDGKKVFRQITVYLHESKGEMAKPVIYLYPERQNRVWVRVQPERGISVSIPTHNSGWDVTAHPDGVIIDNRDGTQYPYLFWESAGYSRDPITEGFVVPAADLSTFFTEKLTLLGLNNREILDFKEYWLKVLSGKPYYLIRFYDQDAFERKAPLSVTPRPDSIIRVFFDSEGLDSPVTIREQVLKPRSRKGFSVIEWGGMRH